MQGDTIRPLSGFFHSLGQNYDEEGINRVGDYPGIMEVVKEPAPGPALAITGNSNTLQVTVRIDVARMVPVGGEFKPVSESVYVCISY